MENIHRRSEMSLAEEGTERKQNYGTVGSDQPYGNQAQPRVIVQRNINEHFPNQVYPGILPSVQLMCTEGNGEKNCQNVSTKMFLIQRNESSKSDQEKVILSTNASSDLQSFDLDVKQVKNRTEYFHDENGSLTRTREENDPDSSAVNKDQELSFLSESSLSNSDIGNSNSDIGNSNSDIGNFRNSCSYGDGYGCNIGKFQKLTPISQVNDEYVADTCISDDCSLTEKLEARKKSVQGTQSNLDDLECDGFHPDEQITGDIMLEETVVTIGTIPLCAEKAETLVCPYTCGLCPIEFNSICKLHDHIQCIHETGSYIFYSNTKTAFPKLESACKNTQTDLADLIEDDLVLKNNEAEELDELIKDWDNRKDIIKAVQNSGDYASEISRIVESEKITPGKEKKLKKVQESVARSADQYQGELESSYVKDRCHVSLTPKSMKRKLINNSETVYTGSGKGKSRLNDVSETDPQLNKEGIGCKERRKKENIDSGKSKKKFGKEKLSYEVAETVLQDTSTRLTVNAKEKNSMKDSNTKIKESLRKSDVTVKIKKVKTSETTNQSKKNSNEGANVELVVNESDCTLFKNEGNPGTEEVEDFCEEESSNQMHDKGENESIYFSSNTHHQKICPAKLKLKDVKNLKRTSRKTLNEKDGAFRCQICTTSYASKVKLRCHMTKMHKKESKDRAKCERICRWCGVTVPGSQSYAAHARQCEKNENLNCLICNKKFSSKIEVSSHLITHNNTEELNCRLCDKTFSNVMSLHRHLRHHNRPKTLQCEQCGKAFYYFNLLKKHMAYCNREPDVDCPHCELKFKTAAALKTHMSVHSNERPFVCHICGYAVKKSMYLKRHIRRHTGERPFTCTECGMSFAAANGLNRHRKTHTNEKPCICQYCGKSFVTNWNLKTHLRQHTGDTPYRCEQCGKAFKQNVLLKLHKRSHHPD